MPQGTGAGKEAAMAHVIELAGVYCDYGQGTVLRAIDLTLDEGEFVGIIGPSGGGKSTLLRTILGLVRSREGTVRLFGRPPGGSPMSVGYVPQLETIDWTFPVTLQDVVMMGRYKRRGLWPWPTQQDREAVESVLGRLRLRSFIHRPIGALSGGQQRRAFLARELIGCPHVLLLDEPTAGTDMVTRHEIFHLLLELADEGTTIVLTTHEFGELDHLPRIVCLNRDVIAAGPPQRVLTAEVLLRTYGGAGGAFSAPSSVPGPSSPN